MSHDSYDEWFLYADERKTYCYKAKNDEVRMHTKILFSILNKKRAIPVINLIQKLKKKDREKRILRRSGICALSADKTY